MKFSFVILHYLQKSVEDTIECIESILNNIDYNDYNIVVVDNGSKDRSGEILIKKYSDNDSVDIELLEDNLGFAKGNNHGAVIAINTYSPDFLVIINNDTVIKQRHFLNLIEDEYNAKKFDVLGPHIFDRYLYPQNPIQLPPILTVDEADKRIELIEKFKDRIVPANNSEKTKSDIKSILKRNRLTGAIIRGINKARQNSLYAYSPYKETENAVLHGSAMIFAKSYYADRDYIFYPETFLYGEEDILYYICKRDSKVMRYQPKIKIYHKEDASSNARFNTSEEKKMFKYEQALKSYKILQKLILKDEKRN